MKKFISLVTVLGVLIGVGFSIPTSKAYADVVQPDECYPAVLMFRGSGEDKVRDSPTVDIKTYEDSQGSKILQTNGYEGDKISRLLESFAQQTNAQETVSRTRFIGVDYPALPVFPDMEVGGGNLVQQLTLRSAHIMLHVLAYQDSYNEGALRAINIIKDDMARGCNTQYAFVGLFSGSNFCEDC